jgi:hypothetical protein
MIELIRHAIALSALLGVYCMLTRIDINVRLETGSVDCMVVCADYIGAHHRMPMIMTWFMVARS